MKAFLRRYRVFLALVAASAVLGAVAPDIGRRSLEITWRNVLEMMSVIPPIFVLLGLLDVWVDRATMMRYTGKGSGLKGALIAFLLGSAAAGPLYAAFPVASVMIRKGSSLFNVFIFIGAWSTAKIPMLAFEATNLGMAFTLLRLALSVVGIAAIAFFTERSLTDDQRAQIYEINESDKGEA